LLKAVEVQPPLDEVLRFQWTWRSEMRRVEAGSSHIRRLAIAGEKRVGRRKELAEVPVPYGAGSTTWLPQIKGHRFLLSRGETVHSG